MRLVYGFERLELHVRERVIDLLPTQHLRRAYGYIVPVVRPWRIRPTGILMTLDLLASRYHGRPWLPRGRRSASSERTTASSR